MRSAAFLEVAYNRGLMRYHKLDLNLLTALKALLTEKNVTRAGESVHITQSAMSGILARLRDYFGDPLIVQVGRRMELTPLAESLVEPVSDVLLRIDATIATRPEFDPLTTSRRFSVVASDYSINVLLLDVLRRVHREAPGVVLEFRTPSESAAAELEAAEVDFIINPESQNSPMQSGAILFEDSYTIVVDAANSEVGDSIGIDQYLALRHVAFKSGRFGLPQLETWLANRHGDEAQRGSDLAQLLSPAPAGHRDSAHRHDAYPAGNTVRRQPAPSVWSKNLHSTSRASSRCSSGTNIATWTPGSMWIYGTSSSTAPASCAPSLDELGGANVVRGETHT